MVTRVATKARRRGGMMVELLVAMALLTGALLPTAYSLVSERQHVRACYQRAVAMELVDGEMEALRAGEWKAYQIGTQDYQVKSAALTNLPPGRFVLTVQTNLVRLEWLPGVRRHGGSVVREMRLP